MRLKDKVAVIIGAGQSAGETLGNGRATVLRFAQEGARIFAVDRDLASADETAALVRAEGGECETARADVVRESELKAAIEAAHKHYGRIDILHYNVGISVACGDALVTEITEDAFDLISAVNLRGAVMACKHALPIMRAQKSGVILMISSISAWENYPNVAYKVTKAGMIAFTQQLAIRNAEYGIRANAILPGLMATPMAVDVRSRTINKPRDAIMRERDARVPLRVRQGTAWDVANAAFSSRRMKLISSPAYRCRWMAACWWTSPLAGGIEHCLAWKQVALRQAGRTLHCPVSPLSRLTSS
jgi:NAD(P)-dependent dehydrogenase (short-subunit alcohol dehydrogenase family)